MLLILFLLIVFFIIFNAKNSISKKNQKMSGFDYRNDDNRDKAVNIIYVILAILIILSALNSKYSFNEKVFNYVNNIKNSYKEAISENNSEEEITVNYPISLGNKTKQEIYDIRRNAVRKSIFNIKMYEPSEEVFGQIVDNKPWYSISSTCKNPDGTYEVSGPSEEARFI